MRKRYKPLVDKLFFITWVPTGILMLGFTLLAAFAPSALFIMIPVDIFTFYFLFSPLSGYAELREHSVFIKFGFIMKREIPYSKIRSVSRARKFYSESMLSLKNSFEHIDIKYNKFDIVCISVVENEELIKELTERMAAV